MVVTNTIIYFSLAIAILLASFAYYLFWSKAKFEELEKESLQLQEVIKLKLNAYERITLFTERMKIENLMADLPPTLQTASELRAAMAQKIQEEYNYNVTQQLYIKPEIWHIVGKMKDQNLYIVNQVASLMPSTAPAPVFKKNLLVYLNGHPDATLNTRILEAVQYEVTQLMRYA